MCVDAISLAVPRFRIYVGSGLLATLSGRIDSLCEAGCLIFVLTTPEVWALWSKQFLASFYDSGRSMPHVLFLPAGEQHKCLSQVESLADDLVSKGADRSSVLITFGGGVVGDLGGFLAAVYMRGISYVQVPSTLLSQVDASVGGKTGVNLAAGKNLLGSFHHPLAVFIDPDLLQTVNDRELRSGLYESLRAAITLDADFFSLLEAKAEAILSRDPQLLEEVITRSVQIKTQVVSLDEREGGLRMVLNFGHTVGHAIESVTGYAVRHGEAVAWGMLVALRISIRRGLLSAMQAERIERTLLMYGPLPALNARADTLVEAARIDKKRRAGVRHFVLSKGIGLAHISEDVTDNELHAAVEWMLGFSEQRRAGLAHIRTT